MLLWRISNHCDLDGLGGERADGRWHTAARGKRIVYLSEHPALALVEVLANLKTSSGLLPEFYQLMKVAVAEAVTPDALDVSLSKEWRENLSETRGVGDRWLTAGSSALLIVPSGPSPESSNYLLNPHRAAAKDLKIEWCRWVAYDKRVFQTRA